VLSLVEVFTLGNGCSLSMLNEEPIGRMTGLEDEAAGEEAEHETVEHSPTISETSGTDSEEARSEKELMEED
jgi:hypothetical protein